MPSPSETVQERLERTSEILRSKTSWDAGKLGIWGSLPGATAAYGEAVVAVLMEAVQRYTEAAAKDRESQEKNRQAEALAREARERRDDKYLAGQRLQGWIMLGFTVVIAISTALYTVAAWLRP